MSSLVDPSEAMAYPSGGYGPKLEENLVLYTPVFLKFLKEAVGAPDKGTAMSQGDYMEIVRTRIRDSYVINRENFFLSSEIDRRAKDFYDVFLRQFGLILNRLFAMHPRFTNKVPANQRLVVVEKAPADLNKKTAEVIRLAVLLVVLTGGLKRKHDTGGFGGRQEQPDTVDHYYYTQEQLENPRGRRCGKRREGK